MNHIIDINLMDECKYTDYNDIQISALQTHEYYITDINWSPPPLLFNQVELWQQDMLD